MSAKNEEMTPEQAVLYTQVFKPAFAQKCAELGLVFSDEGALEEALETAALVKIALHSGIRNTVKTANQALKHQLGFDVQEAATTKQANEQSVVKDVAQSRDVRQAILAGINGTK